MDARLDVPTAYIEAQTLMASMHDYVNPRDAIFRMVKGGELIRLKNGFYLISRFAKEGTIPFEQIANLLYGPSYVSLEWALSFYQFIPERVTTVTSMTTGSKKEYVTPIGTFTYLPLNLARYSIGIHYQPDQLGGFLIGTPEKALADWVFQTCQGLNEIELRNDLLESKRMEIDSLQSLNLDLLWSIAYRYDSKIIYTLFEVIKALCKNP